MATKALDLVTVMHAMRELAEKMGNNAQWNPITPEQDSVIHLYETWWTRLLDLGDLKALASEYYEKLNQFLVQHGFEPKVEPFAPTDGLGVVSILDKTVQWRTGPGTLVDIYTEAGVKPGFALPDDDVTFYVVGDRGHLIRIHTKSDDDLWLFVPKDDHYESLEGLDMVGMAFDVMGSLRLYRLTSEYEGVQVPMVDFDIEPDVSFLLGMDIASDVRTLTVVDAGQQFKFRMDNTGARVKVATHMSALELCIVSTSEFVVDKPFFGWFTHKGSVELPIAVFHVDYDAMVQPEGSLEDL